MGQSKISAVLHASLMPFLFTHMCTNRSRIFSTYSQLQEQFLALNGKNLVPVA